MSSLAVLNLGISAATQYYFSSVVVKPYRALDAIIADAVIEEQHQDDLMITDHPVERGALITDHAYRLPSSVVVTYGWSEASKQNTGDPAFLENIYNKLLELKDERRLFEIYTGKRHYKNMLIQSLTHTTNQLTEHVLLVRITCREVLLASARSYVLTSNMKNPKDNAPVSNTGTKQLQDGGNFNQGGTQ